MANATLEQESPYWHSLVSPQSLCWHLRTLFLGINLSLRCCKERPELSKRAWRFCPRSQSLEDRYCNAEQSYPRLPVCLSVLFFRVCSFIINSFNIYHVFMLDASACSWRMTDGLSYLFQRSCKPFMALNYRFLLCSSRNRVPALENTFPIHLRYNKDDCWWNSRAFSLIPV